MDLEWLEKCSYVGETLYGCFSVTALKRMYEAKPGCRTSHEEVIAGMEELTRQGLTMTDYLAGGQEESNDSFGFYVPMDFKGSILDHIFRENDNPYASVYLDEKERSYLLTRARDDMEYYIPTWQETEQLLREKYIRTSAMTRLEEEIRKRNGDPAPLIRIWAEISVGKLNIMDAVRKITDLIDPASETGDESKRKAFTGSPEELNQFMACTDAFLNSVNLRYMKGWRLRDLIEKSSCGE